MNENLDLAKILKDCPEGTPLYSTVHGNVKFKSIDGNTSYPITVVLPSDASCSYTSDGRLFRAIDDAECVLFPSKDQRDWSKFKSCIEKFDPKELNAFDKVLIRHDNTSTWNAALFSHFETIEGKTYAYAIPCNPWNKCIPYNDETKHLIGTTDDCPEYYKWWEV